MQIFGWVNKREKMKKSAAQDEQREYERKGDG